jgi:hypothetical protein
LTREGEGEVDRGGGRGRTFEDLPGRRKFLGLLSFISGSSRQMERGENKYEPFRMTSSTLFQHIFFNPVLPGKA